MDHGTTEELAAAAAGYLAHSGPFYVDEEAATLRHHMSVSLFPNWIGDTQERFVELGGDTLTISTPPVIVEGIELTPRLIWKRASRTLSVLAEGIEGLRLEAVHDLTRCFCSLAAADDLVGGVSVEDSFEQHPHNHLPNEPASAVPRRALRWWRCPERPTRAGDVIRPMLVRLGAAG
jgi:hypothetical protein